MRYVMRIAEFSESSNLWTQVALVGTPASTPSWVSVLSTLDGVCCVVTHHTRAVRKMRVLAGDCEVSLNDG